VADDTLASEIGKALAKYGDDVVLATWQHFAVPFMPVAQSIAEFQELVSAAQANQLRPSDVIEAIALLGALRTSDDPHRAWVAAEILARNTKSPELCMAAMRGQAKDASERPN
jgi:hypothetical protein